MPNKKISDFTELTTPADGDLMEIVDVSDTSEAPTGTNKKVTVANILAGATVADSSTTVKGKVELATDAETITGTDSARAVTPSNITAAAPTFIASASHAATSKTTPADADELGLIDSAASWVLKKVTVLALKLAVYAGIKPAEGTMWNGKISVTDTGSGINVALKTLSGADASSSDPIYITIAGAVRTITGALSVTKADGTNWCNAGSAELATKEIDYFVYLGYNSTDGVVIGFSRIPGANSYDDFSTTTTNEKYCAISTITNAAATDYYEVIGRFAATLSAGAGYTWSVPTYTAKNLIQRPIYETKWITWQPTYSASGSMTWTSITTDYARYKVVMNDLRIKISAGGTTGGTANTDLIYTIPFSSVNMVNQPHNISASVYESGWKGAVAKIAINSNTINTQRYDGANFGLGTLRYAQANGNIEI